MTGFEYPFVLINLLKTNVTIIQKSTLQICSADQLTDFYMMGRLVVKRLMHFQLRCMFHNWERFIKFVFEHIRKILFKTKNSLRAKRWEYATYSVTNTAKKNNITLKQGRKCF